MKAGVRKPLWTGAALLSGLLLVAVAIPLSASAQTPHTPPPIEETPPTEAGLGACDETIKVGVLNDDFNTLPEDMLKRKGNGGLATNCILDN